MASGREAMIRIIPSALLSQTGPAHTRAAMVAFAGEGEGLQRGEGGGGWGGVRTGGGETQWELNPTITRTHLSGSLLSSWSIAIPTWLTPSAFPLRLPSSHLRWKTRPCLLQRCRDALPQITGPARQPLAALRLRGALRVQRFGCPAPGLAVWAQLHRAGRTQSCGLRETPARWCGHSGRFPVHAGKSPPASAARSPPPPGLHYYFYPGCSLRLIWVSAGLAGLLGGGGGGELDADQAGKKSLSGQLSRVGWGVEAGGELPWLASPNPRGRRECVRA